MEDEKMVQIDEPTKQRERRKTSSVVSARGKKTPPQSAERNYHRFADWLCQRHAIGETEAKQVWTSLAREIDEWITTEHPRGVAKSQAVSQGIRRRMKLPDPRIVTVETHRGGRSTSLYEVRGRRFAEHGFTVTRAEDPEEWDLSGEETGEMQPVQIVEQPAAMNGDILVEVSGLVERAKRAEEVVAKTGQARMLLEDARTKLGEAGVLISRALDELR